MPLRPAVVSCASGVLTLLLTLLVPLQETVGTGVQPHVFFAPPRRSAFRPRHRPRGADGLDGCDHDARGNGGDCPRAGQIPRGTVRLRTR